MNNDTLHAYPRSRTRLARHMLIGALIGLLLITLFLLKASGGDPSWGRFWMVRPLLIVPLAGAMGGAFFDLMGNLRTLGGWIRAVVVVLSVVGFGVALWMGMVLGLDGTYWN